MNRTDNKTVNALDPRQQKYGGMDTPAAGVVTDIKGFSLVREQVRRVYGLLLELQPSGI